MSCNCVYLPNTQTVHKYWRAILNGCTSCMKQYYTYINVDFDRSFPFDSGVYDRYVIRSCEYYIGFFLGVYRMRACRFRGEINNFLSSSVNTQKKIDTLVLLKSQLIYNPNKLDMNRLPILNMNQIISLININWRPRPSFWDQYVRESKYNIIYKTYIILKNLNDAPLKRQRNRVVPVYPRNPLQKKTRSSIHRMRYLIYPYIKTKINLYILKRKGLLHKDTASVVESFLV